MDPIIEGNPIEGFPAYRVTPDGQVWSAWKRANTLGNGKGYVIGETFKLMKQGQNQYGHKQVGLNKGDGYQHRRLVHRLVLEAFIGPCPWGMQCRHDDGNPANNFLMNLLWGTPRENQLDRKRHGTSMEGETHPGARFSEQQILEMIAELDAGARQVDVARKYGTYQGYVSKIYRRKNWKCLQGDL